MKKYKKIVKSFVKESYPELKEKKIKIREVENVNYFAVSLHKRSHFLLKINKTVRNWSETGKKAMLAHELAHFLIYKKQGFVLTKISDFLEDKLNWFKKIQERKADKTAIKRGFASLMIESRKDEEKQKDSPYMTAKEIKKYAQKHNLL